MSRRFSHTKPGGVGTEVKDKSVRHLCLVKNAELMMITVKGWETSVGLPAST